MVGGVAWAEAVVVMVTAGERRARPQTVLLEPFGRSLDLRCCGSAKTSDGL